MPIGNDDLLNVSVGRLPATKHTYNLQKEAFRSSVTSPFMSNAFSIARATTGAQSEVVTGVMTMGLKVEASKGQLANRGTGDLIPSG